MTEPAIRPLSALPKPEIVNVSYCPENTMALAILNKAYMPIMPIADRTRCVEIGLTFLHPDQNGLAGPDEFPTLERFGDATGGLIDELNGAFIVRNTSDGVRTTYFYATPDAPWKESLQKHLKAFPGYRIAVKSFLDPEWKVYRKFLPLLEVWRQIALGKALMKTLESRGDDLKSPRMIDHSAKFTDPKGRDVFIQWAIENGFTIRKTENLADAAAPEFILGFDRIGVYDATFLYHLQYRIILALAQIGGRYLGSGSPVISRT